MTLEEAIAKALVDHPEGLSREAMQKAVRSKEAPWKFRRALKALEMKGALHIRGRTRTSKYFAGPASVGEPALVAAAQQVPEGTLFSKEGADLVALVSRPLHQRTPCSYERSLLDSYQPNRMFYLREQDRRRLREVGTTSAANQPAGTYARDILERLLIDLSWNSSRLEGNTYSLLDTERLFRERSPPQGHPARETQMLLNHKQAIEYLVEEAGTLTLEARALRTLHGMLAENLLPDPADEGRLRQSAVGIQHSTFIPLVTPQLIQELFGQLLTTSSAIEDPFEQSFFLLAHIPYLQPFADVNKRTSRLAANIPLLKQNLQPLSFVDVPREAYTLALLALYEQRRVEALRDIYLWAYQRSAERYRAIIQSLGEPDTFRLKYRDALRELVRTVVLEVPRPDELTARINVLSKAYAPAEDQPRFQALAMQEIQNLNEGTFARYRLRPSEFERWSTVHRTRRT
jgi:Fic family protein